jgi:hypothetical protein
MRTVGSALFVSTTSSVDVHVPLVIVHLSVALVPTGTPVTVEVADDGVVIVAVPLTTLHTPVPVEAAFPASVKDPLLQFARSVPAAAIVAAASFVNTMVSAVEQVPFVIVHASVAEVPAVKPVTPEVGEDGVVIVAVPLTTLHTPVPVVAVLPARVKDALSQFVWSLPAFAVVADA